MTWRRWDEAWHDALYGPGGFYRHAAPAEHFATSAQGLGGAGAVLAEGLLELARRHDLTRIVEVAAGRGELLSELATVAARQQDASGTTPPELVGVDVVARPPQLSTGIDWVISSGGALLPDQLTGLTGTLLLAHEWLDVVPCPVVARDPQDGRWHHVEVDTTGVERVGAPAQGADLAWLSAHVPSQVTRVEVGLPRETAHADLLSRVDRGLVLVVDYGHTAATRPPEGTLTGYRDGAQVPPVPDGSCDLTAHVAVDTLGAGSLRTQREALHDLLGQPTLPPHALSRTRPTAYLESLARANALATLTRSGGLGDFWWATTLRGAGDLG